MDVNRHSGKHTGGKGLQEQQEKRSSPGTGVPKGSSRQGGQETHTLLGGRATKAQSPGWLKAKGGGRKHRGGAGAGSRAAAGQWSPGTRCDRTVASPGSLLASRDNHPPLPASVLEVAKFPSGLQFPTIFDRTVIELTQRTCTLCWDSCWPATTVPEPHPGGSKTQRPTAATLP